ncbi:MAG TPA: hypothetical protein VMJ10_02330 [Kofleriaceae bacterium]|nr:hypothetical protein [Kofleriaceae bacterium]
MKRVISVAMWLVACHSDHGAHAPDAGDGGDAAPSCTSSTGQWATLLAGTTSATPSIATAADGNVYVAGYLAGAWLVKLDPTGAVVWQKLYASADSDFSITTVVATPDLGALVAGEAVPTSNGTPAAWIAKVDATGSIVWQQTYDVGMVAAIAPTSDGGWIATGQGGTGVYVMTVDATGAVQSASTYDVYPTQVTPYAITATSTGSVVAGYYAPSVTDHRAWVIALDAAGAIQWQQSYGGGAGAILAVPDGYVMAGAQFEADGSWVVKLDSTGAVAWQESFAATDGSGVEYRVSAIRPNATGYAIAGQVGGFPTAQSSSAFFAALDANGALLGGQYYGGSTVSATMYAMDTAGCDFVFTGFLAGEGAWVAKVDAGGSFAGCSLVQQASLPVAAQSVTPIAATFAAHTATITAGAADAAAATATAVASSACP